MDGKSDKEILEEFIYDNTELERLEEIIEEFNIFTALSIQRFGKSESNKVKTEGYPERSGGYSSSGTFSAAGWFLTSW